jgi:hypothetical protein
MAPQKSDASVNECAYPARTMPQPVPLVVEADAGSASGKSDGSGDTHVADVTSQ